ncbi:MAG: RNA polymerase factor sigma-54 [Deltaproteobacteria bacterium]|nr:RNA polymerase factor sigma-54 [Deltaproteobacteria bacterium]
MKNKLTQRLTTSITLSPQLQQVLKFLQLSNEDFVDELSRELRENPLVEIEEKNENIIPEECIQRTIIAEREYSRFKAYNFESIEILDHVAKECSLQDHLANQINELKLDPITRNIMILISYYLDRDGFRVITEQEIADFCNVSVDKVFESIEKFKLLDPIGVGAKDAVESLLWQLEALGFSVDSLPCKLLTEYRDYIQKGRLDMLVKKFNLTFDQVQEALRIIRHLNPRPGLQFDSDIVVPVKPDLKVEIVGYDVKVELVKTRLPKVKLNRTYLNNCSNKETLRIFREHYRSAQQLIKAQSQRENSLLRIAKAIVEEQKEFFLSFGSSCLKALTLKDIGAKLNLHESTVSRATTNKYIETPFGVFELKSFFVNKVNDLNNDTSSERVKRALLEVVGSEEKDNPLNDSEIANALFLKYGIRIARRTVAKYREILKIPAVGQRKFLSERQIRLS